MYCGTVETQKKQRRGHWTQDQTKYWCLARRGRKGNNILIVRGGPVSWCHGEAPGGAQCRHHARRFTVSSIPVGLRFAQALRSCGRASAAAGKLLPTSRALARACFPAEGIREPIAALDPRTHRAIYSVGEGDTGLEALLSCGSNFPLDILRGQGYFCLDMRAGMLVV